MYSEKINVRLKYFSYTLSTEYTQPACTNVTKIFPEFVPSLSLFTMMLWYMKLHTVPRSEYDHITGSHNIKGYGKLSLTGIFRPPHHWIRNCQTDQHDVRYILCFYRKTNFVKHYMDIDNDVDIPSPKNNTSTGWIKRDKYLWEWSHHRQYYMFTL